MADEENGAGTEGANDVENRENGNLDKGAEDTRAADQQQQQQQVEIPDLFKDLQDADTREWITKRGIKGLEDLAKTAREQSKLLGNAIRVPGKDATEEEREAFLNKLGRPEKPDGYDFKPPEDLPENLPYDAERASSFRALAHKAGLTQAQAQAVHDWAVANAVEDFNASSKVAQERNAEIAKSETAKLEKLWGPLNGETMKVNLSYADKALRVGGDDVLAEFKRVGLIGEEGGVILSAPIAIMMAKFGQALFKEDNVLTGKPDRLDNPFADGKAHNVTAQMKLVKEDKATALAFIAAAGKKPEDFGLRAE